MSKKYLPAALATFTRLGGINTLLTVGILAIGSLLLTNPARAETLDYSRGIQFLGSHKDISDKVIAQFWEQDGRAILSQVITDELREWSRNDPYFAENKIDRISITTGENKTEESNIYDYNGMGSVNLSLKNNTIRFVVIKNNNPWNPFSNRIPPAEAIVTYDLSIDLTMNTGRNISSICTGYLLAPSGRIKIETLNATDSKLSQRTNSFFDQTYGMSPLFRKVKLRLDRDTAIRNYLADKIKLAIEQNVPAAELQQSNRKVRVFRGQQPVVNRGNVCPEYVPQRNQPE